MFSNLEYYKNSGLYDIEKEVQIIEYEEDGVKLKIRGSRSRIDQILSTVN